MASPAGTRSAIARRLRDRVHRVGPREASPEELIAAADVVCVASGGPASAPGLVRKALATGTVPVASHLDLYEELIGDGERGLLFPPGDAVTLAGQLERLIAEPEAARASWSRQARGAVPDWGAVADQVEEIYQRLLRPPPRPGGNPELRAAALAAALDPRRPAHAHRPLARLRDAGRGAARDRARPRARGDRDHRPQRDLGRARRARGRRARWGIKVIVAEEVKTAEQGEVIGLFLEEKIASAG